MMRLATLLLVVVATALAQKSAQAADFGAYKVEGLSVQKAVISPNSFGRMYYKMSVPELSGLLDYLFQAKQSTDD